MIERGHHDLPKGTVVAIVTSLEMLEKVAKRGEAKGAFRLERQETMPLDAYRRLFRRIGAEWLWTSRLLLSDDALAAHIHAPDVEVHVLMVDGVAEGIAELDFRKSGECEMSFFGVSPAHVGKGCGRWLMNRAIERAWSRPIARFWLHTCTLDSPQALVFYIRSGFVPFRRQVEVFDDPRLNGTSPRTAAAHMPILD